MGDDMNLGIMALCAALFSLVTLSAQPANVEVGTTSPPALVQPVVQPPLAAPAPILAVPVSAPASQVLPPLWLAKSIDVVEGMPIVGPYVVISMKWIGLVASVCTALVTALLGLIISLSSLLRIAKLENLAVAIQALNSGPIMYWLKFFSMYNAKKPEPVEVAPVGNS